MEGDNNGKSFCIWYVDAGLWKTPEYLSQSEFLGKGEITDYAFYGVSSFPVETNLCLWLVV